MFNVLRQILNYAWMALLIFWFISARRAKKPVAATTRTRTRNIAIRVGVAILIIAVFLTGSIQHSAMGTSLGRTFFVVPVVRMIEFAVAMLGMLVAIWARVTIGRNWGVPMSLRENHELVTSGPYAWVRHPIYTGIWFALLGTTLFYQLNMGIVIWVLLGAYYLFAAFREERTMLKQFPQQYSQYQTRTKMLIPFVF